MDKVIMITFAGRKDRMSILYHYVVAALDRGLVDEWHVWNYARTVEDEEWVNSLNGPKIRVLTPNTKESYADCYQHYTPKEYTPQAVFLKVDDDIVYMDVDKLEGFVQYRKACTQPYIVSANVVNNPGCFLIQESYGCWRGLSLEDLKTSEGLADLHTRFVENPTSVESPDVYMFTLHESNRWNINFVSWLGKDLASTMRAEEVNGDEVNLSVAFPLMLGRPIAVYCPLVVSHLSFAHQTLDVENVLEGYRTLAKSKNILL